MQLEEPKDQRKIDRNLFIICWLLILPSISLFFVFNGYVLALVLIGGFARLLIAAVRLPSGQRGYFQVLFFGFGIVNGIISWLEFIGPWIYLIFFWGFLLYSDWRLLRYCRVKQVSDGNSDPVLN